MIQPLAMVIETCNALIARAAMFRSISTNVDMTKIAMATFDDVCMFVPKEKMFLFDLRTILRGWVIMSKTTRTFPLI